MDMSKTPNAGSPAAPNTMCDSLANTLKGKSSMENGVCHVMIDRKDIQAAIGSIPFHSLSYMFDFEPSDANGNALITGGMVLLEDEVPEFVAQISDAGIVIGAIHNHWLFDDPKLMYMNIETIMNPMVFAAAMARILYR